jgi:hypothetical protein
MKLVMETGKYLLLYKFKKDNIKMDLKAVGWECVEWGQGMTLTTHYCLSTKLTNV